MAKKGMRRPSPEEQGHIKREKNDVTPVPEIQGKAKKTKQPANPM